jgi:hypothetical protein
MPHKRKHKQAAPPPQVSSSSWRFSFDWFSDTEDYLAEALARADTSSAVVGGGTPPQLLSPLLESLPLPSVVLGPEFHRLNQAFATIDLRYLNLESDGDDSAEGVSLSPPPPVPSTVGDSGAVPQNPAAFEAPAGPSLHPQDENAQLWGHVLLDVEAERMRDAVEVTLYPLPPPPTLYTVGAPGASLWNPDADMVSIDTVHPQDVPLAADVLSLSCVIAQRTQDIAYRHADNTHDMFVHKLDRLVEDFSLPVDVSSVPLSEQQGLCVLAASTFSVAAQCFPNAQIHEQSCPLFHEADSTSHPPLFEGGTTSDTGGPTASGSSPNGLPSPPQARCPRKRRPAKH